MSDPAHVFVLIAEDQAHLRIVGVLSDRVALASLPWLDGLLDSSYRDWQGFMRADAAGFVKWKDVRALCQQHQVPRRQGLGLGLQRRTTEMALRLMMLRRPLPAVVALLCDADRNGLAEVRASLDEGRRGPWPFRVVIGVCHPEAEAWYLHGYSPENDREERRLRDMQQELGYNPCEQADRLASGRDHHKRSAKRVLGYLVDADPAAAAAHPRAVHCIQAGELDLLRRRGTTTGLAAFLDEVRDLLIPCYTDPA